MPLIGDDDIADVLAAVEVLGVSRAPFDTALPWYPSGQTGRAALHPADSCCQLTGRPIRRMGYGAMQLAGPGVFGPPDDRDEAIAVLRRAVELGVDHLDTSQYYGPDVVNDLSVLGVFRKESGKWRFLAWQSAKLPTAAAK